MAIKKLCQVGLLTVSFFSLSLFAYERTFNEQTIQINTRLHKLYGNPSWLLIIRDEESQRVFPYVFDFNSLDNFWVVFSHARSYRVTVSRLQFGPYGEINNFCHLENRSMSGQSLNVTLNGDLSPVASTSQCHVQQYQNYSFTITDKSEQQITPEGSSSLPTGLLSVLDTAKQMGTNAASTGSSEAGTSGGSNDSGDSASGAATSAASLLAGKLW